MLGRILHPQPGQQFLMYRYWHDRLPHRRAYRVILDRQRQDAVEACAQAATHAYSLEHLLHVRQERESLAVFH